MQMGKGVLQESEWERCERWVPECGRHFDRRKQSKDAGPGTQGHQDAKPRLPSNGQN